jgi:ribulose kinase
LSYFLGIDGGTESLRAFVFDLAGRRLASAATPYPTVFGSGARAEQDPEDWWSAIASAVREAVAQAGVPRSQIKAMCLATTCCSVVALDEQTLPLRPAIIWMDVRAGAEADAVLATGDPALRVNGGGAGPVSAEWMIPKALWLARHEPQIFERAHTIAEYQDFLTLRLTGRRVASLDNASIRWHYSSRHGGWPTSLVRTLGLESLRDKWPAEVVAPGVPIGILTPAAAAHLDLPPSVVVVQGGADALIGMIGLGVARPGQLALITGSSHLQFGVSSEPVHQRGLWGAYADAVYPDRYILEGGQTSTGSIVAWLRRLTGGAIDLATLNSEAAKLEPGADGLLMLDHFQGNRTPHTDPLARGAIVGLSLHHTAAHLFLAMLESIGFGTRAIVDKMAEAGCGAREITAGGGATQSPLWLQIHADTAGVPVHVPAASEAPALGAAILAAHGAGEFATIDDGIAAMVRPGRRIEPRADHVARYAELYEQYVALYPALKALRPPAEPATRIPSDDRNGRPTPVAAL